MALLAALTLLLPDLQALLAAGLAPALAAPLPYLSTALLLLLGMFAYAYYLDRRVDPAAIGWMLYLLAVSIWEEWFFRLALPHLSQVTPAAGLDDRVVIIAANLAFGALHYFTLRWKWPWCVAAFLGGMALSRNLQQNSDLVLIIGIHWLATYINTPRLPGHRYRSTRN